MKQLISFHSYRGSPAVKLNQYLVAAAQESFLIPSHIVHTPYLAGHGPKEESNDPFVELSAMFNGVKKDISDAVAQNTQTLLIGTSLSAYPILEWLQSHPENETKTILVKPAIDLEYSIQQFAQEQKRPIPVSLLKRGIRFDEYDTSYGTTDNPFVISTPLLIISGEKDTTVGNSDFASERVIGSTIYFSQLRNAKHYELQHGELDIIGNIIHQFR